VSGQGDTLRPVWNERATMRHSHDGQSHISLSCWHQLHAAGTSLTARWLTGQAKSPLSVAAERDVDSPPHLAQLFIVPSPSQCDGPDRLCQFKGGREGKEVGVGDRDWCVSVRVGCGVCM
jgi:hypothetical protein